MQQRIKYVTENVLRFVILAVVTVLLVVSVVLFVEDPARGALAGAITALGGWIGWKMTDQASYRELTDRQDN
jgi:Na+/H+-translocating membrane pyrophosphatase